MSSTTSEGNRAVKTDHLEIEWQFEAGEPGPLEAWLADHPSGPGFTVSRGPAKELVDAYYDTDDWRFYRAGYALRVRRSGPKVEATLKSLGSAEDGLRRRREISAPLRSGGPKSLKRAPSPVGGHLRALAGTRDMRLLVEIQTRRQTFEIHTASDPDEGSGIVQDASGDIHQDEETSDADGVAVDASGALRQRPADEGVVVGEIALDESEISTDDGKTTRLRRVEVEISEAGGIESGARRFAESMRDSLGLGATRNSKFEAGLDAVGLIPAPEPEFGSTEIDETMSTGGVAFAVLRRNYAKMLVNEPGVRLGEDPEELHDMRVATRRLRAALRLYAGYLPKRAQRFERDLRHVGDALGEVRDLDVLLERIAEERLDEQDEGALPEAIAALQRRRSEERGRMLVVLDSERYERFVTDFSGMLRRGRGTAEAETPILEAAPQLVRRRRKKARKAARRLTPDSPPEAFHDARKKGRRLRYALEPLVGIYGNPAEETVDRLKEFQDDLGDHQDLIVTAGTLRELSGDLPPRAAFGMGVLATRYVNEAGEIRDGLWGGKPLKTVRGGKAWKRLRKALDEKAGG